MVGTEIIKQQLAQLGYKPTVHYDDSNAETGFVSFEFMVPLGRFRGQQIEIAITATQFPAIPPTGPYIKPHLLPITGGGGTHPFGGIHEFNMPTAEFQYWSRPCNEWIDSDMNMKSYLAFLRTLFDFE
jgi:hypothetical protein